MVELARRVRGEAGGGLARPGHRRNRRRGRPVAHPGPRTDGDVHMDGQDRRTAAGPGLLARTAAVVATGCAVLHLLNAAPEVPWTALAVACLPCAVHLWFRPGRMAWGMHIVLGLAMAAHPVVAAALPAAGHGHAHGRAAAGTTAPSLLAGLGLFLAVWRWWLARDLPLRRFSPDRR